MAAMRDVLLKIAGGRQPAKGGMIGKLAAKVADKQKAKAPSADKIRNMRKQTRGKVDSPVLARVQQMAAESQERKRKKGYGLGG